MAHLSTQLVIVCICTTRGPSRAVTLFPLKVYWLAIVVTRRGIVTVDDSVVRSILNLPVVHHATAHSVCLSPDHCGIVTKTAVPPVQIIITYYVSVSLPYALYTVYTEPTRKTVSMRDQSLFLLCFLPPRYTTYQLLSVRMS